MGMPIELALVRHGRSEGNTAMKRSWEGDESDFTPAFRARHSWQWRLTSDGVRQAKAAGAWMRKNLDFTFDGFFVSEYIRAVETAGHLRLPDATWKLETYLRERDLGVMEGIPMSERKKLHSAADERRRREPLLWIPESGHSIADVCLRVDRVFDTLHREYDRLNVVMVCHGEFMWGALSRLERLTIDEFNERQRSKKPHDEIHNCQILHYSRRNPEKHSDLRDSYCWVRSVCPWNLKLSSNDWRPIVRRKYTSGDLLERAEKFPRMVS